jgi:phosphoglycerate dehydrogenase-like enzyme
LPTLSLAQVPSYLTELDETARTEALRNTGVLLTFNTSKELQPGEAKLLNSARLIQFMIGGVDFIPLGELPEGVPVATNGGGYAESMAEHALTMALAAAKRLVLEHENLKRAQFNQFTRNRMLAGRVCGIFGFGGIGAAAARLMHGIGMRVHANDHLVMHPNFTACIYAWWVEPVRHGQFRIDQPFIDLPNVIASPHNSAQGDGAHDIGLRRAVENCRRALTGEAPLHLIGLDERLM